MRDHSKSPVQMASVVTRIYAWGTVHSYTSLGTVAEPARMRTGVVWLTSMSFIRVNPPRGDRVSSLYLYFAFVYFLVYTHLLEELHLKSSCFRHHVFVKLLAVVDIVVECDVSVKVCKFFVLVWRLHIFSLH